MAARPLLFHALLFIGILTYSLLKTAAGSFTEHDIYLKLRVEGQWELGENSAAALVLVEESEIEEITGRRALFLLVGTQETPSSDRFEAFGRVELKGGSLFISSRPRDVEELPPYESPRKALKEKLSGLIGDEAQRAIAQAFLLGELRRNLPYEVESVFLRTGLVHVLVVSGLHVGLVFFILSSLLPGQYGKMLGILGVLLYSSLLVPPNPPVLRATLMFLVYALSWISHRRHCGLCSLFFSGSVLLLFFPHFSLSLSFWLSFFAVLYILLTLREGEGFFRNTLLVSLAAFTGTAPLIGSISFVSPLSVFLSPLVAPVVTAYAFFGVLSLLTLFEFPLTLLFMDLSGRVLYGILSFFSEFSPSLFPKVSTAEAFFLSSLGAISLYLTEGLRGKLLVLALVNLYLLFRSF